MRAAAILGCPGTQPVWHARNATHHTLSPPPNTSTGTQFNCCRQTLGGSAQDRQRRCAIAFELCHLELDWFDLNMMPAQVSQL